MTTTDPELERSELGCLCLQLRSLHDQLQLMLEPLQARLRSAVRPSAPAACFRSIARPQARRQQFKLHRCLRHLRCDLGRLRQERRWLQWSEQRLQLEWRFLQQLHESQSPFDSVAVTAYRSQRLRVQQYHYGLRHSLRQGQRITDWWQQQFRKDYLRVADSQHESDSDYTTAEVTEGSARSDEFADAEEGGPDPQRAGGCVAGNSAGQHGKEPCERPERQPETSKCIGCCEFYPAQSLSPCVCCHREF